MYNKIIKTCTKILPTVPPSFCAYVCSGNIWTNTWTFIYKENVVLVLFVVFCDGWKFNLTVGFFYFSIHDDQLRNNIYLQRWWMRLDLILSLRDIYINSNLKSLTKFTSRRSTEFKDILPWNISQIITKAGPISMRITISNQMKQGTLLWMMESQWKLRQQHDQNFPMKGKPF